MACMRFSRILPFDWCKPVNPDSQIHAQKWSMSEANPLRGWKGWQARLLQAQLSAILIAFVSIFYHGFAIVFARCNIAHAHRYSNLCSFAWRKVCPQCSAQCTCRSPQCNVRLYLLIDLFLWDD